MVLLRLVLVSDRVGTPFLLDCRITLEKEGCRRLV